MAITVQMQFESAVTEMYQDAFVGSSNEASPQQAAGYHKEGHCL
jgi:hypothetical protein